MSDRTSTKVLPEEEVDVLIAEDEQFPFSLVVWNDEVNTFDWVIASLMEVCGHTHEQAEQCALIIHFNGKYAVKQGEYIKLRPLCEALQERGLSATIEEMAGT
ncbi:ATP-dependent Clp protease adaptor ClpS [Chitinophaga polysaccharea]|uniref:ATP-dependent Clp protease adaptor ClpS n=1 Tax=Chitinophaga TaxID=79328 RepID=UPI001454FB71|nr:MULTISPECIES: ATP-dependent Clp protease adaptor ClpS [Chitinophaga]NLR57030.1 ATP-dependent Clp protease adaptor ClpS [Chitinophaga polysaccharea]NLU91845.1 ATP-dependent Clp protease adaptor ClpS [Chitinophaga sp. Ak27]